MSAEKTITSKVARDLGVPGPTLRMWCREGYINPELTTRNSLPHLLWTEYDIQRARRMRDRNGTSPVVAVFGPEVHAAVGHAWRQRDFGGGGNIVVAGPERARILQSDDTLRTALARVAGDFLVILR